jgi:hypothetical protein
MALTERDRAILDFERESWMIPGRKDQAIRARFMLSPSQYYRLLGRLLDDPSAMTHDPLTVKRLVRQRGLRRRVRFEGQRVGPGPR